MVPRIAIAGRPNVGKSTLFNRLAGRRMALVDDRPGVTRDWREAEATLGGLAVVLIDTAGLEDRADDLLAGRDPRRDREGAGPGGPGAPRDRCSGRGHRAGRGLRAVAAPASGPGDPGRQQMRGPRRRAGPVGGLCPGPGRADCGLRRAWSGPGRARSRRSARSSARASSAQAARRRAGGRRRSGG